MKNLRKISMLLLATVFIAFSSCKDDPEPTPGGGGDAKIENMKITPSDNLKYGDVVALTADLSADAGLTTYAIEVSNAAGSLFQKGSMLTGKTFSLNEKITIPLPANSVAGDLTVKLTINNAVAEELTLSNVAVPTFDKLYIEIGSAIREMTKEADNLFVFEGDVPADAAGKIYAREDKTGLFWGKQGDKVVALGNDNIVLGSAEAKPKKISFNSLTFELVIDENMDWAEISEALYIYGSISGHWADGNIIEEKEFMKMQGYSLGSLKKWTWQPAEGGTDDPGSGMWGNINPGSFRFKKAGANEFLVWSGGNLSVVNADNESESFKITAGGGGSTFTVFADVDGFTSVQVEIAGKVLEYTTDGIKINGVTAPTSLTFGGNSMSLIDGEHYAYEGVCNFENNQKVTAIGMDLATAFCDPNVFTGGGNTTWTVIQPTSKYFVSLDAFLGEVYVRNDVGYPEAIYFDGWGWAVAQDGVARSWLPNKRLTLFRKGDTNVYEATFWLDPWATKDGSLFAVPPGHEEAVGMIFLCDYFTGITAKDATHFSTDQANAARDQFRITVDFKDGFTWNKETLGAGDAYTIIPNTADQKFEIKFTQLTFNTTE